MTSVRGLIRVGILRDVFIRQEQQEAGLMATGFECATERRLVGVVESFRVSTDVPRNALMLSSRFLTAIALNGHFVFVSTAACLFN